MTFMTGVKSGTVKLENGVPLNSTTNQSKSNATGTPEPDLPMQLMDHIQPMDYIRSDRSSIYIYIYIYTYIHAYVNTYKG